MVKKASGKWRMYVDFTDLNRACPKDSYPFPRVDVLVDSTAQHQLLSFMDAFSGYNQIRMDEADQEKTSFVTSQGLFCYKVMPFGLKKCRRDISEAHEQDVCTTDCEKCLGLCGWHAGKKSKGGRSLEGSQRNIQHPSLLQHEAQSGKMCIWGDGRKVPRIQDVSEGNRDQPRGTWKKCKASTAK